MDFFLHILISIGHWLPTILGYNLIFGKGKILHFGPMGVSAAVGYSLLVTLTRTGNLPLAIAASIVMAIVISTFFSWLSLRLESDAMGVMSLAVYLAIIAVILNWPSITRGALGIRNIPRLPFMESIEMFALVICASSALITFGFYFIYKSSLGRQLEALADNKEHAQAVGVNQALVYSIAFIVLGLANIFGNYSAYTYIRYMHPNDFSFVALIFSVMVVVAGKPGSYKGAIIATVLLVTLKEAIRFIPIGAEFLGPLRLMIFGFILFAAVWWRRDSLFPHQRKI